MEKVMTGKMEALMAALMPYRKELIAHPLYKEINSLTDLQVFSQHHVFAVWDFMSLLKSLQIQLTSTTLPWKPIGDSETRYLINEIVTGEESDIDEEGVRCSHYELYLRAMQQLGADTSRITQFVQSVTMDNIQAQIQQVEEHPNVGRFLQFTFDTIQNAPLHVIAAVFTFGREDLIPDMFIAIVRSLAVDYPERLSIFRYYLERHIEVDGDEHSILGKQMVEKLCGDDAAKWQEATQASIQALQMRKLLWDGILEEIKK